MAADRDVDMVLCFAGTVSDPVASGFDRVRYSWCDAARLIVADQRSVVALVPSVDVQCYNYSLPYAFGSAPDVAVGICVLMQLCMISRPGPPMTSSSPSSL